MIKFIERPILIALLGLSPLKISQREIQAATIPIPKFFRDPPTESVAIADNIGIIRNFLAIQNVVVVFNHVVTSHAELSTYAPEITKDSIEVVTRVFAEQLAFRGRELRERGLFSSLDAFERSMS